MARRLAAICWCTALVAAAAGQSPDEELWTTIDTLGRTAPGPQPGDFAARRNRCRELIDKARRYQRLYPGGPRRDEAVRIELSATFEFGAASGGEFAELRRRVDELLAAPGDPAAEQEAAYWAIHLRRLARHTPDTPAGDVRLDAVDPALLEEYRAYVEKYPASRFVPRFSAALFEDALQAGRRDELPAIAARLRERFPKHAETERLAGRLLREETVGRPFAFAATADSGESIDLAVHRGKRVALVVWSPADLRGRRAVAAVEELRRADPDLDVVAISFAESRERTAAAAAQIGLTWPQVTEPLAGGSDFARRWGVQDLPCVFLVDRSGNLVGSGERDDGPALLRSRTGRIDIPGRER